MLREGSALLVFSQSIGKLLKFCNGVHCDAKYLLKIGAFWEELEIISLSTSRGGMTGTFFVTKKAI